MSIIFQNKAGPSCPGSIYPDFLYAPRLIRRIGRGVPNVQKQIELNKMDSTKTTLRPVSFDVFKHPLFWPGHEYLWLNLEKKD